MYILESSTLFLSVSLKILDMLIIHVSHVRLDTIAKRYELLLFIESQHTIIKIFPDFASHPEVTFFKVPITQTGYPRRGSSQGLVNRSRFFSHLHVVYVGIVTCRSDHLAFVLKLFPPDLSYN